MKWQGKKYKTIYADLPWPERGGGKIKRGADGGAEPGRRKRGLRRKKRPKILPPFRGTRTERERLIIEAFERDLLRAADRFKGRALDIGSFLEAWRDDRASEVIEMIERGDLT